MQTFYTQLFQMFGANNPYWQCLVQLTKITPAQMVALKSNLEWIIWTSEVA